MEKQSVKEDEERSCAQTHMNNIQLASNLALIPPWVCMRHERTRNSKAHIIIHLPTGSWLPQFLPNIHVLLIITDLVAAG